SRSEAVGATRRDAHPFRARLLGRVTGRRLLPFVLGAAVACTSSAGVHDVNGDGRVVVACLGDSNTESRWPPPYTPKSWEMAAETAPGWTFVTHAVGGATVTRPTDDHSFADRQLDLALADRPDAVVLAFGTNDVRAGRTTPEVIAAYRAAVARVTAQGALA